MWATMGTTMSDGMTITWDRGKPKAEPWWRQRHGRRVEDDYMIMLEATLHSETMTEALFRRTLKLAGRRFEMASMAQPWRRTQWAALGCS